MVDRKVSRLGQSLRESTTDWSPDEIFAGRGSLFAGAACERSLYTLLVRYLRLAARCLGLQTQAGAPVTDTQLIVYGSQSRYISQAVLGTPGHVWRICRPPEGRNPIPHADAKKLFRKRIVLMESFAGPKAELQVQANLVRVPRRTGDPTERFSVGRQARVRKNKRCQRAPEPEADSLSRVCALGLKSRAAHGFSNHRSDTMLSRRSPS
jgi:hypothetical protein